MISPPSDLRYAIRSLRRSTGLTLAAVFRSTALAACYLPARRAARVDPITALGAG